MTAISDELAEKRLKTVLAHGSKESGKRKLYQTAVFHGFESCGLRFPGHGST